MPRRSTNSSPSGKNKSVRPALSPEAREQQMIGRAVDLAEKQLMEGTASTAVIVHYLKLGSSRNKAEMEKLNAENQLNHAKIENMEYMRHSEELTEKAIKAFAKYSGHDDEEEYEEFEDGDY